VGYGVQPHFQQYFSYIVETSFIDQAAEFASLNQLVFEKCKAKISLLVAEHSRWATCHDIILTLEFDLLWCFVVYSLAKYNKV
jgi:hypothetical protein